MLIVLTPPDTAFATEIDVVHQLFDAGLEVLHLRKTGMNRQDYAAYIRLLDPAYHCRIALHQYHELAAEYGIDRLHFSEQHLAGVQNGAEQHEESGITLSTSLHLTAMPAQLPQRAAYAFVSPVFDSISKPGYKAAAAVALPAKQKRNCKLVALGGINAQNCMDERLRDFDGIALLGGLWMDKAPVSVFKNIQQQWNSAIAARP